MLTFQEWLGENSDVVFEWNAGCLTEAEAIQLYWDWVSWWQDERDMARGYCDWFTF
jgi:hypothetical protein